MGRVGSNEFKKDSHYEELITGASLAVKTKMDAIINWYEANNWEDALKLAQEKCNESDIAFGRLAENRFKGKFVSENNALLAISKIAKLAPEQTEQFINEFYTQGTFSPELREIVTNAFSDEPEKKLIHVLRNVHVSWNISEHNKFQMWNDKKGIARNAEHQFDDLLLMQFGEDGATADKLFVDSILTDLGITIDDEKLKEAFINQQKKFLGEIISKYGQNKTPHQALVAYLQSGQYIAGCEKRAGHKLTTYATAIKNDPSRADYSEEWAKLEEIRIADLTHNDSKIAESMAQLMEQQIKANGIDMNSIGANSVAFNDHLFDDDGSR